MAINYQKINEGNGWNTQTSLGPTNLNHMEQGIKEACDAIDVDCLQVEETTPIEEYVGTTADFATRAQQTESGKNIDNEFDGIKATLQAENKSLTGTVLQGTIKHYRSGNVCVLSLGNKLTSGAYSANDVIFELPYKPLGNTYALFAIANSTNLQILRTRDKALTFNNAVTIPSGDPFVIGELVYITNDPMQ